MNFTVIKHISPEIIERTIEHCYSQDQEFIEKYVMGRPATVQECMERGKLDLGDTSSMIMYQIWDKKELVGYFGKDFTFLNSFFILPGYRNKDVYKKFWKIVKSKFIGTIYCGLFAINTRGIAFIKKAGFKKVSSVKIREEDAIVYCLN